MMDVDDLYGVRKELGDTEHYAEEARCLPWCTMEHLDLSFAQFGDRTALGWEQ